MINDLFKVDIFENDNGKDDEYNENYDGRALEFALKDSSDLVYQRKKRNNRFTPKEANIWYNESVTMVYGTERGTYIKFTDGRCYFDDGKPHITNSGTIDKFFYIPKNLIDSITVKDLNKIDRTTRYSTKEGGVLAFIISKVTINGNGVTLGKSRLFSLPLIHLKGRGILISDDVSDIDKVTPSEFG